jgi:hypothetical protein
MDKFDLYIEQMKNRGADEIAMIMTAFEIVCVCPNCPTYNDCSKGKSELLYCLHGKSQQCAFDEEGCSCPDCPVALDLELKFEFYCSRGSEKDLRES